jgi:hypothetical protein
MGQFSSVRTGGALTFVVHSTFRDKYGGVLHPVGLQWNLPGKSHVTYVPLVASNTDTIGLEDPTVKRGIVEAHNLWSFAREQAFRTVDDIESLSWTGRHVNVEWNKTKRVFKEECFTPMAEMIEKDEARKTGSPAEVWINGRYISTLSGPGTENPILEELSKTKSVRLAFKRSDDSLIRIERYFGSYLRDKNEVFDHIMDNLIALEDIKCIDSKTVIGTATLRDWIMGGTYVIASFLCSVTDLTYLISLLPRSTHQPVVGTRNGGSNQIHATLAQRRHFYIRSEV